MFRNAIQRAPFLPAFISGLVNKFPLHYVILASHTIKIINIDEFVPIIAIKELFIFVSTKLICPFVVLIPTLHKHAVIYHGFERYIFCHFMNHVIDESCRLVTHLVGIAIEVFPIASIPAMQTIDFNAICNNPTVCYTSNKWREHPSASLINSQYMFRFRIFLIIQIER